MTDKLWLPTGRHQEHWGLTLKHEPMEDAGSFAGGGHKIVWHTTEGNGIEGALHALRVARSAPHFIIEPRTGEVIQAIPLNQAGRSLMHPSGPETNRANVIQVEIVGFAADSGHWGREIYKRLAALATLINHRFEVPTKRAGDVSFEHPHRLSGTGFYNASGHCGHVHVPGNDHTDPGTGFKIQLLFDYIKEFAK